MEFGIQEVYKGEFGDNWTTRLSPYEGSGYVEASELADGEHLTEEEIKDCYEFWRTTDGKIFADYDTAVEHEKTVEIPELHELADKLNEALIFADKNKSKSHIFKTVASVLKRVNGDGGDYMMQKYYDSTC